MKAADLFSLPESLSAIAGAFSPDVEPWLWVKQIREALRSFSFPELRGDIPAGVHVEGPVFIDPSVRLPHVATIIGPSFIGPETEIRPGAFIRGNVIVGRGCVLGNACEFKNALLMDRVQVPHFSYVGDSILGNRAHLGAGVVLSNMRLDQKPVPVATPDGPVDSGLRKLGAILGEAAEVGCNAVLQPGTVLGKRALVLPTTSFSGYLPDAMIAVSRGQMRTFPRKD